MTKGRDAESVIADYLGQFALGQDDEPRPEPAGLIRWLADEGWVLVPVSSPTA
jgi:hypothetical protein